MKIKTILICFICLISFLNFFYTIGEGSERCVNIPKDIKQWQICNTAKDCVVDYGDCGKPITFNGIFIKEEAEYTLCKPLKAACENYTKNKDLNNVKVDCINKTCVIPKSNQ